VPAELILVPEARGALSVYPVEGARDFGIDAFVTDRFGGVSEGPYDSLNLGVHVGDEPERVIENRRRVARAIGVDLDRLVIVRQVHGNDVVRGELANPETSADAILTSAPDHALAILVADCLPVLLFEESSAQFAVVHAGWRGLASAVLASAVAQFGDPGSVHAFIGPSISAENYQVGPEVAAYFSAVASAVHPDGGDRSRLDLRRVALSQLIALGVSDDHLSISTQATDGGETFFSDRAVRPCGRFALVARRAS
jgi:YfiH family protein